MELVAILVGGMLLDLAFRGTEHQFAQQLEQDFGQSEFWTWAAAIWIVGALGAVKELRTVSNLALALIVVVLILKNGGFFSQAQQLITHLPSPAPAVPISSYGQPAAASGGSSGGSSGGGGFLGGLFGGGGGASGAASTVGEVASIAAILA